jgi:hypothetical protein
MTIDDDTSGREDSPTITPTDSQTVLLNVSSTADGSPVTCTVTGLTQGMSCTITFSAAESTKAAQPTIEVASPTPPPLPPEISIPDVLTAENLGGWWDASHRGDLRNVAGNVAEPGDYVVQWLDRSRRGLTMSQDDETHQGILGTVNGRPALECHADTFMTSDTVGTFHTVFTASNPDRLGWATTFASPANTDFSQRQYNGEPGDNHNDWHHGNEWGYRVNGINRAARLPDPCHGAVIFTSFAAAPITNTASLGTLFMRRSLVGALAEVIVLNRQATHAEVHQIERYLAEKWGATLHS